MAGRPNQAMRSLRAERRRDHLAVAVLCSALLLANAAPARAQYAHPASERAAKEFRDGQDRLARTERRARVLEADVAQMGDERAKLTVQLQETARLVQKSEAQLNAIERRRDALEAQQKQL